MLNQFSVPSNYLCNNHMSDPLKLDLQDFDDSTTSTV